MLHVFLCRPLPWGSQRVFHGEWDQQHIYEPMLMRRWRYVRTALEEQCKEHILDLRHIPRTEKATRHYTQHVIQEYTHLKRRGQREDI